MKYHIVPFWARRLAVRVLVTCLISNVVVVPLDAFTKRFRDHSKGEALWQLLDITSNILCDSVIYQDQIPLTIATDGHYAVGENLTSSSDFAIDITVSNVVIDLNKHTISVNHGGSPRTGVQISATSAIVENGAIRALGSSGSEVNGIANGSTENNLIVRNYVFRGTDDGDDAIDFDGCDRVYIENVISLNKGKVECSDCTDVELVNVVVYASGDEGIRLAVDSGTPQHATLRNCSVFGSDDVGIRILGYDEVSLYNCGVFASVNTNDGFQIEDCNQFTLYNCVAMDNSNHGFNFDGSENGALYDCVAMNNLNDGFHVQANANRIVMIRCSALNNDDRGFVLEGEGCIICDSLAVNNTNDGIRLFPTATDNIVMGCKISNHGNFGLQDEGTDSGIYNNANKRSGTISGVALVDTSPSGSTGFWENVDE